MPFGFVSRDHPKHQGSYAAKVALSDAYQKIACLQPGFLERVPHIPLGEFSGKHGVRLGTHQREPNRNLAPTFDLHAHGECKANQPDGYQDQNQRFIGTC